MPVLFTSAFSFSHPFPLLALAVLNKYPNPHSPQVVSVDVLGRTMLDDGTLRSERVLGVRQDAPKWMRRVSSCSLSSKFLLFVQLLRSALLCSGAAGATQQARCLHWAALLRYFGTDTVSCAVSRVSRRDICARSVVPRPKRPVAHLFVFLVGSSGSVSVRKRGREAL